MVIGISVAESCGIQGTWPDSYSMLLSSRFPARPQLRPSVGGRHMPRYTVCLIVYRTVGRETTFSYIHIYTV